jgi:selenocysteine-specific elongation factor
VTRPTHRVVATAGHVDHGKSTLVRALTGMEPDRLADERRRGLTIELGYAWTTLRPAAGPGVEVAFVDVPGHERFVATMLAGAGPAPAALLVVAADDGVAAQTVEHRDVLALLEVPGVATVVTKADAVPAERLAEVRAQVVAALAGTSLADAPVVATDGVTGRGLDRLGAVLAARLGPDGAVAPPPDLGRPRLWVDRVFTVTGVGTVVTGTLGGGHLDVDTEVVVPPDPRPRRIRGLEALGQPVTAAGPGTRVAVALGGVERAAIGRGDVVVTDPAWRPTDLADVWVRVLPGRRVDRRGAWHLHVGSASTTARVLPAGGALEDGARGIVRVRLDRPLVLATGDRVVLRDAGRQATVAGGRVADPDPQGRARQATSRARARHLEVAATTRRPGDAVLALVAAAGGTRPAAPTRAAAGWPAGDPPAGLAEVGGWLVDDATLDAWRAAVTELGSGPHDRDQVAAAARALGAPPEAAAGLAEHLAGAGALARTPGGYAPPDAVDRVAGARDARATALLAALTAVPFDPPDLDQAARAAGVDHRELAGLVASGQVVRCGRIAVARSTLTLATERLEELAASRPRFTAAEAKAAWGTTRRVAIPLLEQLDRLGVTRFDGQLRELTGRRP